MKAGFSPELPSPEPNKEVNPGHLTHEDDPPKSRKPGFAKGKLRIKDDFDDPIPGMEEYMP